MSWGRLVPAQARVLADYVAGALVHDLGAGDMRLALHLVGLGAVHVTAVDRQFPVALKKHCPSLTMVQSDFGAYKHPIGLAFVSWPETVDTGLVSCVARARTVAYLGRNYNTSICGDASLLAHLRTRRVLAYVPDPANTLIVYGQACSTQRRLLGEEAAWEDWVSGCRRFGPTPVICDREVWPFAKVQDYDQAQDPVGRPVEEVAQG